MFIIPPDNQILFYRRDRSMFGFLSNFFPSQIEIEGVVWPHTEAFYQAQKSESAAYQRYIRQSDKPVWAKHAGDSRIGSNKLSEKSWFLKRPQDLRDDWQQQKLLVMREAIHAKFTQNAWLQRMLLATDDATLVEDSKSDTFWGTGRDNSGTNFLGVLLMELREKLTSESPVKNHITFP